MEIIKLDRRHKMYHEGFRHALRFPQWDPRSRKIEDKLKELYPKEWRETTGEWMTHWPRYKKYWIGFKNESTITQILLTADLE
jgi:hypothetical protein